MTLPQQQQPVVQSQSQHFLLKWNNHRSNMVSVFDSLLQSENLVDVTLAVEGQFLKGHKIVLSACSPYFEAMFVNQTPGEKHPILIFHDMKFSHLKTLLDFMYRGEISIDEKDLSDVLKVAEALSIRGLSSFESDDEDSDKSCGEANGTSDCPGQNPSSQPSLPSTASSNNNCASSGSANASNCNGSNPPSNPSFSAIGSAYGYNGSNAPSSSINNNNNNTSENNNNSLQTSPSNQDNHCGSGNSNNCDSSVNGTVVPTKVSHKTTASARGQKKTGGGGRDGGNTSIGRPSNSPPSPPPPVSHAGVKRRRGRPIKKETLPTPSRASTYKQPSSTEKFQTSRNDLKPLLTSRQKVRRRIPKQFGIASNPRIKQEKSEGGRGTGRNTVPPDEDDMDTSDFMLPDMDGASGILPADMCNSEPLSEMSVRGLDLFKYASIENGVYRCTECEKLCIPKTFKNKYSFQRHAFLYHEGNMRKVFPCPVCSREFSRPDKMKNHLRSVHEGRKNSRHTDSPIEPASSNDPQASNEPQGSTTGDSSDFNDKCDV